MLPTIPAAAIINAGKPREDKDESTERSLPRDIPKSAISILTVQDTLFDVLRLKPDRRMMIPMATPAAMIETKVNITVAIFT